MIEIQVAEVEAINVTYHCKVELSVQGNGRVKEGSQPVYLSIIRLCNLILDSDNVD